MQDETARRDTPMVWRVILAIILLTALGWVVVGTNADRSSGDTANSRLATVVALTHHGTWFIDRPVDEEPIPFEQRTIDKVQVGERLISSKPPLLPLVMTAEYVLLRRVPGWSLDNEQDVPRIVRFMCLTLIGLPFVVGLVFFYRTTGFFGLAPGIRVACVGLLAFGTQLFAYATHINNHLPATSLLIISLYFAFGMAGGHLEAKPWRFVLFGVCGAAAFAIDLPSGFFVLLAGLYLLWRFPKQAVLWAGAGAALPLLVHFGSTFAVTGSILPVQMNGDSYLYEASYWRNPTGVDAQNEPRGTYLFHMTFGRSGLFMLYPILAAGLIGLFLPSQDPSGNRGALRWIGGIGLLIVTVFYLVTTTNYGGSAYGFRWYIIAMPVLALLAGLALERARKPAQWAVIAAAFLISAFTSWDAAQDPWRADEEWTVNIFGPRI